MTIKGILYTIAIFLLGVISSKRFFNKITSCLTTIFSIKNDNNSSVIFLNTPIDSTEEDKVLIIEHLQSEIRLFKDLFIKNNILNEKEINEIESLETY